MANIDALRIRCLGRGVLILLLVSPTLSGCARISPQAVVLSEVATERTGALHQSHEAFVRGYFDQTRSRVDDFLVDKWTPSFLEELVNNADNNGEDFLHLLENVSPFSQDEVDRLAAALKEAGFSDTPAAVAAFEKALGGGERGAVVLQFAEAAVSEIENKRRKLLDPIDDLEKRTLAELRTAYNQLQQIQSSLTGHLRSLAEVQAEQDHILQRLRLLDKRDRLVDRAIGINEGITGVLAAGHDVADTVTALEERARSLVHTALAPADSSETSTSINSEGHKDEPRE